MKDYKVFGDVPLQNAMIIWNGTHDCDDRRPFGIAVVPHPERPESRQWNLQNSCCAPFAEWKTWPTGRQLLNLYVDAWHIICRDGITPEMMHDALSVIPEYRETLTGEKFFTKP
jgi:hypothetical protein